MNEVSLNPLVTQDVQLCSEHKKLRKLFDFIRVREEEAFHFQYVQKEDAEKGVRQRSIALIFVNKAKTGDFVLDFVRKVGMASVSQRQNWSRGPSGRQKQGRIEHKDSEEEKNLRIDFLHSKLSQPYPFPATSVVS